MRRHRHTRARSCDGKRRHTTRASALAQIRQLFRRDGAVRMRAYECGFCGNWHVGHLPKTR